MGLRKYFNNLKESLQIQREIRKGFNNINKNDVLSAIEKAKQFNLKNDPAIIGGYIYIKPLEKKLQEEFYCFCEGEDFIY